MKHNDDERWKIWSQRDLIYSLPRCSLFEYGSAAPVQVGDGYYVLMVHLLRDTVLNQSQAIYLNNP